MRAVYRAEAFNLVGIADRGGRDRHCTDRHCTVTYDIEHALASVVASGTRGNGRPDRHVLYCDSEALERTRVGQI